MNEEETTDLEYREAAMRLAIQSFEHRDPSPRSHLCSGRSTLSTTYATESLPPDEL